jgi:hypothetical protein
MESETIADTMVVKVPSLLSPRRSANRSTLMKAGSPSRGVGDGVGEASRVAVPVAVGDAVALAVCDAVAVRLSTSVGVAVGERVHVPVRV